MKKALALLLAVFACNASATCRLSVLQGQDLVLRGSYQARVVQVRLVCDDLTQGQLSVENSPKASPWGSAPLSVLLGGQPSKTPLTITVGPEGSIVELVVKSHVGQYSAVGNTVFPLPLVFRY